MGQVRSSSVKKLLIIGVAIVLGVAVILKGMGMIGDEDPKVRVERLMSGIGAEIVDQPMTEEQQSWVLEAGPGETFDLRQLPEDTVVFLNFWATWCKPCRDELPSMVRLRQRMADRRFMMVAVSYDESWDDITSFFEKVAGGMPPAGQVTIVRDPSAGTEGVRTLRETFGTTAIPDTYVVYNGRVVSRFVNARDWVTPSIVEYLQHLAPKR